MVNMNSFKLKARKNHPSGRAPEAGNKMPEKGHRSIHPERCTPGDRAGCRRAGCRTRRIRWSKGHSGRHPGAERHFAEESTAVVYTVDGRPVAHLSAPGEYRLDLDTARFLPGRHVVGVDAYDSAGRKAGHTESPIMIQAAPPPAPSKTPPSPSARPLSREFRPGRRNVAPAAPGEEATAPTVPIAVLVGAAVLGLGLVILCIRLVFRRR